MPPKQKVTKEDIVLAAINLVRKNGVESINARSVAAEIGCSTQPIFSNYATMEELKQDIIKISYEKYMEYILSYKAPEGCPAYKNTGLAYITYAKNERELFKLLFMRHRTREEYIKKDSSVKSVIDMIISSTDLSQNEAEIIHTEMWIFVHGIATMIATDYLEISDDDISFMLTDMYQGLLKRFSEKRMENGEHN